MTYGTKKAKHAIIFERINATPDGINGIGWFCGIVTFEASGSLIIPESEYLIRVTEHEFEVYTGDLLTLNPIRDCGAVEDYIRKPNAWTNLNGSNLHGCRFIHIKTSKSKNVSTYICFGVFNKAFITQGYDLGDTWYELNTKLSIITPPVSSRGHNSNTLLRLPIWSCPALSNELIALEPTTADFLRECDLQKTYYFESLETDIRSKIRIKTRRYDSLFWALTENRCPFSDAEFVKYLKLMKDHYGKFKTKRYRTKTEIDEAEMVGRRIVGEMRRQTA